MADKVRPPPASSLCCVNLHATPSQTTVFQGNTLSVLSLSYTPRPAPHGHHQLSVRHLLDQHLNLSWE